MIEILIATVALALVAVGLMSIFGSVRETVRKGRAVSRLTEQASLIERTMREDFANITRDGFFVISHEYVGSSDAGEGDDPVRLPVTNGLGATFKARRVDQMIFFRLGDFESARAPLVGGVRPRSSVAMVYYGHGQRRGLDESPDGSYRRPEVTDTGVASHRLGYASRVGVPNPNQYPSDWTLLRHVTLLVPPRLAEVDMPEPPAGVDAGEMYDQDIQIALQPAASHVFTPLSTVFPEMIPPNIVRKGVRPVLASGLVDVATTSLEEIRAIVNTAKMFPYEVEDVDDLVIGGDFNSSLIASRNGKAAIMQAWMESAFPVAFLGDQDDPEYATDPAFANRMRYEPSPPDFHSAVERYSDAEQTYRTADQSMLGAANFAPNCTGFKVEWSFGMLVDPLGGGSGLVWQGLENPYAAQPLAYEIPVRVASKVGDPFNKQYAGWNVRPSLIHGRSLARKNVLKPDDAVPLMSYFGFIDPVFGEAAGISTVHDSIPWAWPKLVRVTITLADPGDPTIEETFQFVFELPEHPAS